MTGPARPHRLLAGAAALLVTLAAAGPGWTIRPDEIMTDPKLEVRARAVGSELRCLVCQNESIDDSDADLAHDLRMLVRQRILAGDSDAQVKAYIVARYGDYVLLKPPLKPETYLLWFGPAIMVLIAGGAAVAYFRRKPLPTETNPLSADQDRRLAVLMGDAPSDPKEP